MAVRCRAVVASAFNRTFQIFKLATDMLPTPINYVKNRPRVPLQLLSIPRWYAELGKKPLANEKETSMRFYTNQHQFYCGIDLHARSMYVCILGHDGEILLHRNMQAAPEPFLKAIASSREGLVGAVACLCTWYWLADLCADEGIPVVLGHALSTKAIHGGKAKNDKIDSRKIAALLRGGMLPQASGYPAEMRATRDLRRRRTHLMRKRSERLSHVHNTTRQYT
jgi:hypothetical protein